MGEGINISTPKDEPPQFIEAIRRGESVKVPIIKEGPAELVLIMPALSDIHRLDLLYKIEFKDEKFGLCFGGMVDLDYYLSCIR